MSITDSEILGFAKEVLEIEEGSISATGATHEFIC